MKPQKIKVFHNNQPVLDIFTLDVPKNTPNYGKKYGLNRDRNPDRDWNELRSSDMSNVKEVVLTKKLKQILLEDLAYTYGNDSHKFSLKLKEFKLINQTILINHQKLNIMGVMSCSRKNCDNIMCDTYISSVGYICNECQKEFKTYLNDNSISTKTEADIIKNLKTFISLSKEETFNSNKEITVDKFFSENTR